MKIDYLPAKRGKRTSHGIMHIEPNGNNGTKHPAAAASGRKLAALDSVNASKGTIKTKGEALGNEAARLPRCEMIKILNLLPHCVFLFDLVQMRLTFVNDHAAKLFGYEPGENEADGGLWKRNLIDDEQVQHVLNHIERVKQLRDGETAEMVFRVVGKSGAPLSMRFVDSIVGRDASGAATESLTVGTVVEVQNAVPQASAIYAGDGLGALYWEYDVPQSLLRTLSGDVRKLTGYDEILLREKTNLLEFILEADRPSVASSILSAVALRNSFEIECRIRRKDGAFIWTRITGIWKTREMLSGTVVDITQRMLVNQDLQRAALEERIFNARLTEALEEEKCRHAQFLHDELGQLATRVLMDIDWIALQKTSKSSAGQGCCSDLEELRKNVALLLDSIRGQSHELLPSVLEQKCLPSALEWLARLYQRKLGICCVASSTSGNLISGLSKEEIIALFRISQEALSNIWKHAAAKMVSITLTESKDGMDLRITDDGVGMSSSMDTWKPHVGLRSMQERAKMIGGSFSISSSPEKGTTVSIHLPANRAFLLNPPAC